MTEYNAPTAQQIGAYIALGTFLERVKYKPGWKLWAEPPGTIYERPQLHYAFEAPDAYHPDRTVLCQGYALMSEYDTAESLLREFVYRAILFAEEHEAGEWFRVDGDRPYDPHRRQTAPL
jgi:hypothetical protein